MRGSHASGKVLNLLLLLTFHVGIGGKTISIVSRKSVLLIFAFDDGVNTLLGTSRATELHPEEDDRLTDQHADCRRGDANGNTDHHGEKNEGEETASERKRGVGESVMVSTVMHAWSVMGSTKVSGADVVMGRKVGCLAVVALDGGRVVARQTHAEALDLVGCGCGGSSGGSGFGAGFGHDGTEFGHDAAHDIGALGVGSVGAGWD